ncbi:MAG: methyltransferase domain-containing protein, partial [Cytophagales bacterium]
GYLVDILLDLGYDAYGVDASTSGISLANKRHPNRFFFYDIDSLSIPSELINKQIDTIISLEVVEHIYTPNNFMKSCDLFLAKNKKGEVMISTPYHGYFKNLILAISGKMDNHFTVLWEGGHIKFWSKKTLTILIEKFGYTFKNFIGCGRLPFLWKSMLIVCEK